ncbi:ferritin-like domain-containing protein (plasmid) [Deinococcus sp. PESE-38]
MTDDLKTGRPHEGSRRTFLRGLAGTAVAASFSDAFGLGGAGAPVGKQSSVLDLAATAEALSVTLYFQVLSRASFMLTPETAADLRGVLAAESHHLELLRSLGGRPLTASFALPARLLTDAGVFADTALKLEQISTSAYLGATHQLAAAQPELAATMAQLAASEAQHLTLLSQLSGYGPFRDTLPAASFRQMADTAPALAPYLKVAGKGAATPSLPTPTCAACWAAVRCRAVKRSCSSTAPRPSAEPPRTCFR